MDAIDPINEFFEDKLFKEIPQISIDKALIEKTKKTVVFKASFKWSDIGSWSSLWNYSKKDYEGNAVLGDAILKNTKNEIFPDFVIIIPSS